MPTKNPRINVTLKPSLAAVLLRMSQLTRNSQSGIIGELLEASQPVFERMVLVLEAAQRAQGEVKERVKANLEAAEGVLDKQLGLMLGDLGERSQDLVDDLEAISRRSVIARQVQAIGGAGRRGRAAPAAAPATPLSNRGVVTPPGKGKRGRRSRRGR